VGNVAHTEKEKCIQGFRRGHVNERPCRRRGHRWEDITMNLKEIDWEGADWIHLARGGTNDGSL